MHNKSPEPFNKVLSESYYLILVAVCSKNSLEILTEFLSEFMNHSLFRSQKALESILNKLISLTKAADFTYVINRCTVVFWYEISQKYFTIFSSLSIVMTTKDLKGSYYNLDLPKLKIWPSKCADFVFKFGQFCII